MLYNSVIILTASYATYFYGAIMAVFGILILLTWPCLADKEVHQSRQYENGLTESPERHYDIPTLPNGNETDEAGVFAHVQILL